MDTKIDFIIAEITGYSAEKGYVYAVDKASGQKITIARDRTMRTRDFVKYLTDEGSNTYTPVGSFVAFSALTAKGASSNFYVAGYATPLNKKPSTEITYITPVKIDRSVKLTNDIAHLSATALDERPTIVRDIKTMRSVMEDALAGRATFQTGDEDVKAGSVEAISGGYGRGLVVRIGSIAGPTEKRAIAYEIYMRKGESAEQAIERASKTQDWFKGMLKQAVNQFKNPNGFVEVSGFTRLSFNDYRKRETLNNIVEMPQYISNDSEKPLSMYALSAITVNKETGKIDRILPLNKGSGIKDSAGMLGHHAAGSALPFNVATGIAVQNESVIATGDHDYPLHLVEDMGVDGKRKVVEITGTRAELEKHAERIRGAVNGKEPFRRPDDKGYIFSAEDRLVLRSALSDLLGTPAIYTSTVNKDEFVIAGHIDKEPFQSAVKDVVNEFGGVTVASSVVLPSNVRTLVENRLGDFLEHPLKSVNSSPKLKSTNKKQYMSYLDWMDKIIQNSPAELMNRLHNEIAQVANTVGIDWDETADNIDIPSPGASSVFYTRSQQVKPIDRAHLGSCTVTAQAFWWDQKVSKDSPETRQIPVFSLTFLNKKGDLSKQETFHSGTAQWELYLQSRGIDVQPATQNDEQRALREKERAERLASKAENERLQRIEDVRKAGLDWANAKVEDGSHKRLATKGISDIVNHTQVRRLESGNPAFVYQLFDMNDNFLGLQKVLADPIYDAKGKAMNKIFTAGAGNTDPITGQTLGRHHRIGNDDGQSPIYITEGFSDEATVFLATGQLVYNGLNKDNKKDVIEKLRQRYPNRLIIDVGDNDITNKRGNVGLLSSLYSSYHYGVHIVLPPTDGFENTDINEYHNKHGIEATTQLLQNSVQAPPRNLLDYLRMRLPHVSPARFDEELQDSIKQVKDRYANLDDSQITIALEVDKAREYVSEKSLKLDELAKQKQEEGTPAPQSNTLSKEKLDPAPIVIREAINSKKKPYIVIEDNTGGKLRSNIVSAIRLVMPGAEPIENGFIGGFVAPFQFKNMLNALLHEYTGAPQIYMSVLRGNQDGFVIRGELNEQIVSKLDRELGHLGKGYNAQELGYVVNNSLAIHLVNDAFHRELTPTKIKPMSFDAEKRQPKVKNSVMEAIGIHTASLDIEPKAVAKSQALLLVNENGLPSDEYFMASMFTLAGSALETKFNADLTAQAKYEKTIKYAIAQVAEMFPDADAKKDTYLSAFSVLREKYSPSQVEAKSAENVSGDQTLNELETARNSVEHDQMIEVPGALESAIGDSKQESVNAAGSPALKGEQEIVVSEVNATETLSLNAEEIRLAQLFKEVRLFVEAGYTHAEFMESCKDTAGFIYYDETLDAANETQINADLLQLAKNGHFDWPYQQRPRTLSGVFNIINNDVINQRVEHLREYMSDYMHSYTTTHYDTFFKYWKGQKQVDGVSVVNPYYLEGELDNDLLENDLRHLYDDSTTLKVIYYQQRDLALSASQQEETDSESLLVQDGLVLDSEEPAGAEVDGLGKVFYRTVNDGVVYSLKSSLLNELDNQEVVKGELVSQELTSDGTARKFKLSLDGIQFYHIDVNGGDFHESRTERDPLRAQAFYDRFKRMIGTSNRVAVLPRSVVTENEIIAVLKSGELEDKTIDSIASYFAEKRNIDGSPKLRERIEKVLNAQSVLDTRVIESGNAELFKLISIGVDAEIYAGDFYNEAFKPDGVYFDVNPFVESDTGRINSKELKAEITSLGFVNFAALYESQYKTKHGRMSHEEANVGAGGFIPESIANEGEYQISDRYEKLSAVIEILGVKETDVLVPFSDFVEQSEAYQPVSPILKYSLGEVGTLVADDKVSKDSALLLADVYGVEVNVDQDTVEDIYRAVEESYAVRKTVTLLEVGELAELPLEVLEEYCDALDVTYNGVAESVARRINNKTREMGLLSKLRIAQYSYIERAMSFQEAGKRIPSFVYTSLASFGEKASETLLNSAEKIESRSNEVDLMIGIEQELNNIQFATPEQRALHKDNEYLNAYVVGIEDAKYVSKGKYHYLTNQKASDTKIPDVFSYYAILDEATIGTPTPIDVEDIKKLGMRPLNDQAIMYVLEAYSEYLNKHGYLAFNIKDDKEAFAIFRENGKKFARYGINEDGAIVSERLYSDFTDALLDDLYRLNGLTRLDSVVENAIDAIGPDGTMTKLNAVNSIIKDQPDDWELPDVLKSALAAESDLQGEMTTAGARALLGRAERILGESLAQRYIAREVDYAKSYERLVAQLHDDFFSEGNAIVATVSKVEEMALADGEPGEESDADSELKAQDNVNNSNKEQSNESALYASLFDMFETEQTGDDHQSLIGKNVVSKDGQVTGIVATVVAGKAQVDPVWKSKLATTPANESKHLVDEQTGVVYGNLTAEEFSQYPVSNYNPIADFLNLEQQIDDLESELAMLSMTNLRTMSLVLGIDGTQDRNTIEQNIVVEIDLRSMAARYITAGPSGLVDDELEILASKVGVISKQSVTEYFQSLTKASGDAKVLINYSQTANAARMFGIPENVKTVFEAGVSIDAIQLTTVTDAELIGARIENDVDQLLRSDHPSALYLKANYLNGLDITEDNYAGIWLRYTQEETYFVLDGDDEHYPSAEIARTVLQDRNNIVEINAGTDVLYSVDGIVERGQTSASVYMLDNTVGIAADDDVLIIEKSNVEKFDTQRNDSFRKEVLAGINGKASDFVAQSVESISNGYIGLHQQYAALEVLALLKQLRNDIGTEFEKLEIVDGEYALDGKTFSDIAELVDAMSASLASNQEVETNEILSEGSGDVSREIRTRNLNEDPQVGNGRAETRTDGPGSREQLRQESNVSPGVEESKLRVPRTSRVPSQDAGRGVSTGLQGSVDADRLVTHTYPADLFEIDSMTSDIRFTMNLAALDVVSKMRQDGYQVTDSDIRDLQRFTGWGGVSRQVNEIHGRIEILNRVSADDYKAIKAATLSSYYTPPELMSTVWRGLEIMGFKGGKVLDPSTGNGGFISTVPESLKDKVEFSAIELEPLTAAIAKGLHGNKIVKNAGFEKVRLPNNIYDIATSNIPFGNFAVYDPDYPTLNHKIHDFFFLKSLDKVKHGGVVAFITSTGTLDKIDGKARRQMYEKADLLSAVRLPNGVFMKFAGTSVSTDILFLRKRFENEPRLSDDWLRSSSMLVPMFNDKELEPIHEIQVNDYFINNPSQVAGELKARSGQYGLEGFVSASDDVYADINVLIDKLPANVINVNSSPRKPTISKDKPTVVTTVRARVGTMIVGDDGNIKVAVQQWNADKEDYELIQEDAGIPQTKKQRVVGLIQLRDILRQHIRVQTEQPDNDSLFHSSIKTLNETYDGFTKKFGALNSQINKSVFKHDPDAFLVLAMERAGSEKGEYLKTDVFYKKTIAPQKVNATDLSTQNAVRVAFAQNGRIDLEEVCNLTNKSVEEVIAEIPNETFLDPTTGDLILKEHYLSGNIKHKIELAKAAAEIDSTFDNNVEALQNVMPAKIPLEDIKVRLGSMWVPESIMADFTAYITAGINSDNVREDVTAAYASGLWAVAVNDIIKARNAGRVKNIYGTERIDAIELINRIANGNEIVIKEKNENGNYVVNGEQSALAQAKAETISTEFKNWVYAEPSRAEQLVEAYNNQFNVFVDAKYDGSKFEFTNLNPYLNGELFQPRDTQKNAVLRFLVERRALFAHEVGAGKTFELVAAAIESKARGITTKPMVSVPNNVFGQLARLAVQHYPSAKITLLDPRGLTKERRQSMLSNIALNDWDMVIIPHSVMDKVSAPLDFVSDQLHAQIAEFENAISEQPNGAQRYTNKRLEARIKNLETKIEKLINKGQKEDLLMLNELGVDALFLDESDNYINVPVATSMGHVNGVNTSESQRAMNALFICRYLQSLNDGGNIVFATGTDIRKSMTDMYANLYMLAPDELRALGVYEHDAFMSVFGEVVSSIEVSPEGTGYRENSRLCKFNNLPEMAQLYRTVSDVVTSEMAGVVKPHIEPIGITIDGGPLFKQFMLTIAERSKAFRRGSKEESWFSIQHDAKKAAMDMRLIAPNLKTGGEKMDVCADKVSEIYQQTREQGSTQLIFLDGHVHAKQGKYGGEFGPYDYLIEQLVERGIPREKIIDSRDVQTESQKKAFEEGMNNKTFAVALGTTDRFGVGNNIQRHLYAMHELNPPWNPRDMEQRMGRIARHGNLNKNAKVFRYVKENSFDLFQWETMKRKASFISQAKVNPKDAPREFVEDTDATYGEMMSIATGNPLIKEKLRIDSDLDRLQREKRSHDSAQYNAHQTIKNDTARIPFIRENVAAFTAALNSLENSSPKAGDLTLQGNEELAQRIKNVLATELKAIEGGAKPSDEIHLVDFGDVEYSLELDNLHGKHIVIGRVGEREICSSRDIRPAMVAEHVMLARNYVLKFKQDAEESLETRIQRIESMKATIGPFAKESELSELLVRANELEHQVLEAANATIQGDIDNSITPEQAFMHELRKHNIVTDNSTQNLKDAIEDAGSNGCNDKKPAAGGEPTMSI